MTHRQSVRLLVRVFGSVSACESLLGSKKRLSRQYPVSGARRISSSGRLCSTGPRCWQPWRIGIVLLIVLFCLTGSVARAGTFEVNNFADFQNALRSIALDPSSDHTININANITMTGNVAPIAVDMGKNVTINGNGNQIDGGGAYRPFFAHQGNITIKDLTIQNARAQGGAGGSNGSGGGGLGAGAGLFVDQSANMTLENVQFSNNQAVGGAGGGGGGGGSGDGME